jgi:hypothetical protein
MLFNCGLQLVSFKTVVTFLVNLRTKYIDIQWILNEDFVPLEWFSLHFIKIKVFFHYMLRLGFALNDKLTVVDLRRISTSIPYYKYKYIVLCTRGFVMLALVVVCVCEYVFRELFWECCDIHVSGVVDCLIRCVIEFIDKL